MYQIHCPKQTEMNMSINVLAILPGVLKETAIHQPLYHPRQQRNPWWHWHLSQTTLVALVHRFSVLPEAMLSYENELFATIDRSRGIFSYIIQCSEMRFHLC
ncbi:hypothetical protein CDAR_472981 [Caerostris darwini]|uniref:Uncharacterized protein n=1 Tax=Caerostris darwini TaxID=1538125 RepID=A0AAV4V8Z5_9ARAC|nr:hypothetical protein CDAR_472981 [Caerostris darwini]